MQASARRKLGVEKSIVEHRIVRDERRIFDKIEQVFDALVKQGFVREKGIGQAVNLLRDIGHRHLRIEISVKRPPGFALVDQFEATDFDDAVSGLIESGVPIFGICLGHQMLGIAVGGKTMKMHQGHHGANHPVKDLTTGKVEITSMNHGFAVDQATLPKEIGRAHV